MPRAGCSVDAACVQRGTRLLSGSESWNLSAIGATERAYNRPTSCMTMTSRNASSLFTWYCAPSTLPAFKFC